MAEHLPNEKFDSFKDAYEREKLARKAEELQRFELDLKREVARVQRNNRQFALLYLELNSFKKIAEQFDLEWEDLLLKEIILRLRKASRVEDYIIHCETDRFAIILTELESMHDSGIVAARFIKALAKPFEIRSKTIIVSSNIGIACYPSAGIDPLTLKKNAENALQEAKAIEKNIYQFFTSTPHEQNAIRLKLENELHHALINNEFFLVYQPRFNLKTQKMTAVEVLVRWLHPKRGVLLPNLFLPTAEESGLILPIGKWILQTACAQFSEWKNLNVDLHGQLAVNVSARQLERDDFILMVMNTLRSNKLSADNLELEVSENEAMSFLGKVENVMFKLSSLGVKFSIDDFGTGYSSLRRLKELPIYAIKIARSSIEALELKAGNYLAIQGALELAKELKVNVVAEGVETEEQLQFLKKNECPEAQGFIYSKPLTVEEMTEFVSGPMQIASQLDKSSS